MTLRDLTLQELHHLHRHELREAFPPEELKPFAAMKKLYRAGVYHPVGAWEGETLVGYALLWEAPQRKYVLIDYLGVTAARRNGGLGGAILKMLAAREAGRRTVLVEAEAERSGGPEEERPLRLRRLGFYARNGCIPVYESFNCGLLCQVFVLGPAPADQVDLKAAHRAIYGPARTDVVIDPPPGASPEPPYWM